jgi:hypothetical protein
MRAAAISIALVTLAACGGGGGGGGSGGTPSAIEVPFTSFAAVRQNQTVIMDGLAVTGSGNQTVAPNGDYTVTSANPPNAVAPATVRLSYDDSATPALRNINISTPSSPSLAFDRDTSGHSAGCTGTVCAGDNPTSTFIGVNAVALGWNYQTFGVWTTDTSPTSWVAGATSVGAATNPNAMPITGNAIFTGLASALYVDSGGTPFFAAAVMSANVNFSGRNIQFSTSDTSLLNANTLARTTDNGLNLSGTLSYAQGANSFSGALQTQNAQLTGQGSGRFYGPSAQEIGGVYSLTGAGVSRMIGGFGGKQ